MREPVLPIIGLSKIIGLALENESLLSTSENPLPPFNSVKPYKYPNKIEKKCVMNFYENNVVKENKTNIIIT